jgi:hypothetical protein
MGFASGRGRDSVGRIVDALGVAWTTCTLYPDPAAQAPFAWAVDALSVDLPQPVTLVIGPGTYFHETEEIRASEGAVRLARELFLHDIEYLRFKGNTTADGLVGFLRVIELDDAEVRDRGGVGAVLEEVPGTGIEVYQRGLLVRGTGRDTGEEAEADATTLRLSTAAAAAARGVAPDEIAKLLVQDDSPVGAVAKEFLATYRDLYDHALEAAAGDDGPPAPLHQGAHDPWRGFRAFVEAFFYLPRPDQLEVLESVLDDTTVDANRVLLGQLSSADLADFMPDLSDSTTERLLAFAAMLAGETGRPPAEVMEGIKAAVPGFSGRGGVAERVREVLAAVDRNPVDSEDLVRDLRERLTRPEDPDELGNDILRGLLQCEKREDRFHRVLRVWTGRVSRALRDGNFEKARVLLTSVLDDPPYPESRAGMVREAMRHVAGRDTLQIVVEQQQGADVPPEILEVFETMGVVVADALVAQLAEASDRRSRRVLTELVTQAIREDPAVVVPYLSGRPWYLLRNLAIALGKTGQANAVPGLLRMLNHDDHRVRTEALRSILRVQGREAVPTLIRMLGDDHERVRHTAASLARAVDSDGLDTLLVAELESVRLSTQAACDVVELLGSLGTSNGTETLAKLAGRRFAFRGRRRALRDTARTVLAKVAR